MPNRIERTEQDVRRHTIDAAKREGVLHERNHKGPGAATGFPDDKFWMPHGRVMLVEFKSPGKKGDTSARQDEIIERLRAYGHDVEVFDSSVEAVAAIRERMDTIRRAEARLRASAE